MIDSGICYLIAEDPATRGAFDAHTDTERMVYCTVRSVTRDEMYGAQSIGQRPDIVLRLTQAFEYQGERRCRHNGVLYEVLRTYSGENDWIDLTLQRTEA